jgi:hypothetical protein
MLLKNLVSPTLALLLPLAWFVHNHHAPWRAFHSDAAAAGAFLIGAYLWLRSSTEIRFNRLSFGLLGLAVVPVLQATTGMIHFAGDAWVTSLYLTAAALAIAMGYSLRTDSEGIVEPLLWSFVLTGIASTGIALYQWLRLEGLGVLVYGLSPENGRACANFGQPNQFATFLLFSLASALWLYERRRIHITAVIATAVMLCIGITLAQSRAASLSAMVMLLFQGLAIGRARLRVSRTILLSIALLLFAGAMMLPHLAEFTGTQTRNPSEHAAPGTRLLHWTMLLDAIAQSPWVGYGWNQVPVAIARVAQEHPSPHEFISYSHNLLLDLAIWNGIPLAALVLVVGATWVVRRIRQSTDAESVYILSVVGVLLVHSMFEFPFAYAYFLLPVAFLLGALEAKHEPSGITVPRKAAATVVAASGLVCIWICIEYVRFEEDFRALRFETARVGREAVSQAGPDAVLLTQLAALNRYARTEAARDLSVDQMRLNRLVAERFGAPQVLLRYAIQAGLNEQPEQARLSLVRLCKLYPEATCYEGAAHWNTLARTIYPELLAISFPVRSPAP